MESNGKNLRELIVKLFDVEGLKFGEFFMRNGERTPLYIDMRVIWTYPDIVVAVGDLLWEKVQKHNIKFDFLCGLPYQGLPLASYLSTKHQVPMLMKRQKPKSYGTKRVIEGHYKAGQSVLLVDDVLMTGGTFIDEIPQFQREGLEVCGCVVFCDRLQGGQERTEATHRVNVHRVVGIDEIFQVLLEADRISQDIVDDCWQYLKENRFDTSFPQDVKLA